MATARDPSKEQPRCQKHVNKVLKFYCETCQVLVCRYCMELNHPRPEHMWSPLTDVALEHKEALNESCNIFRKEKNDAAESNRKIEQALGTLKNNKTKARDAIQRQQQNILNAFTKKLEKETTALLDQIEKKYKGTNELLLKQQANVKAYFGKAKSWLESTSDIICNGGDEVLLALKDEIEENAKSIVKERPEFEPVHDGLLEYHPKPTKDVIQNLKLNDLGKIVSPSWQSLFERSTILEGNIEHAKQLVDWMEDKKLCWELCYRASRDGWKGDDFHRTCDDVGPTLTLVKCGTNIFGGYTDQSWKKSEQTFYVVTEERHSTYCTIKGRYTMPGYRHSITSFLFSLKNENMRPLKCPINNGQNYEAIHCDPSSGAVFGYGFDLFISSNANANKSSYSNLGYTYQAPAGFKYKAAETRALLAGSYYFTPSEIEVFRI